MIAHAVLHQLDFDSNISRSSRTYYECPMVIFNYPFA